MLDLKKWIAKVTGMFSDPFIFRTVSLTGNTRGHMGNVTAPNVAGYKFLCWVSVYSNGWVGSPYASAPHAQTTSIWSPTYDQQGRLRVDCVALYHKVGGVVSRLLKDLQSLAYKGVAAC